MKKTIILYLILCIFLFACDSKKNGNPLSTSEPYFKNIQAIDHWNLRYHQRYDVFTLEEQVAQIKANMDVAAELGFNSYVLFFFLFLFPLF